MERGSRPGEVVDGVDAVVLDGAADEEGVAVLAAVVVHRLAEEGLEAGHTGEFGEGVDAADAVGALVDLLEGDDVGVGVLDDAGDALEVEAAVDAFAVVDVIGKDANFRAGARLRRGDRRRKRARMP
jgi:hypothetical protein